MNNTLLVGGPQLLSIQHSSFGNLAVIMTLETYVDTKETHAFFYYSNGEYFGEWDSMGAGNLAPPIIDGIVLFDSNFESYCELEHTLYLATLPMLEDFYHPDFQKYHK